MLFGGLHQDGSEIEAIINYVFPSLHGMNKESVAASLTKMIKNKYVKAEYGEKRAEQYSIRSTGKAALTENRVQQDLSTQ
jgi:hypothetical protein